MAILLGGISETSTDTPDHNMLLVTAILGLELRRGSTGTYYLAYNMLDDHYQFFVPEPMPRCRKEQQDHVVKFTSLYGSHEVYLCGTGQDQYACRASPVRNLTEDMRYVYTPAPGYDFKLLVVSPPQQYNKPSVLVEHMKHE